MNVRFEDLGVGQSATRVSKTQRTVQ
jgi:hypothetical protein